MSFDSNTHLVLASIASDSQHVRDLLLGKSWFGFDLDDTLHEFRKASKSASEATLHQIAKTRNISFDNLEKEYSRILALKTAHAFTDAKTSDDYRKERFVAVLKNFSASANPEYLNELASTYKTTLESSLELKAGAIDLISYLKSIGKKVLIISEGPQDAQEWTIKKLGLKDLVDYIATTNTFGVSKVDGLFEKVLAHLSIEPEEMIHVGDNKARDVEPALKCGIMAIHYCEQKDVDFNLCALRIKSFDQLENLLRV